MDATNTLIICAVIAWGLQIITGFLQMRAFNRMLQTMSLKGSVKIGKTSSRWKPRTLVVLAHNADNVIVDASIMKGLTIFARPKALSAVLHARIPLSEKVLSELDASTREAITCALSTK
ncbi:MAG: transcriptional regulator [Gammaproteobacteria bacterium]|uniref:Glucitol operon activator protein n=1 Tax=Tolumonas osonensis TaxID=675874 RepID=A0A841GFV4_9GAMM|nr:transcriptional regulator GutM [Tolumonas osonensis]MBB6056849.1 glucitol operon activator protein [Tolumonas osonensis]NCB59410.1 transcriptional regulator [Gammaproteobacteria bacterium]